MSKHAPQPERSVMTWDGGEHAQRLSLPPTARRLSVCRRNAVANAYTDEYPTRSAISANVVS